MNNFPETRPDLTIADKGFDETTGEWSTANEFTDAGGGKYKTTLIAIAGETIYYEELS